MVSPLSELHQLSPQKKILLTDKPVLVSLLHRKAGQLSEGRLPHPNMSKDCNQKASFGRHTHCLAPSTLDSASHTGGRLEIASTFTTQRRELTKKPTPRNGI